MKITIITLFPDMFRGFLEDSIVKRAQEAGQVEIDFVNLRDFAMDAHGTVDDRPFGGGAGMVLMVEPLVKALESVGRDESRKKSTEKKYVIATSARGSLFTQAKAREFAKREHMILIAGHYEGYDERVNEYVDEEISVGDFIMTGGELAAACIVDALVRLRPGVLKKEAATEEESFFEVSVEELMRAVGDDAGDRDRSGRAEGNDNADEAILANLKEKGISQVRLLEYPQYTRPQHFQGKIVPEVLISGDPKKIRIWQLQHAFHITKTRRPDLLAA